MPNWIGDLILAIAVAVRQKRRERRELTLIVPEKLCGLAALLCDQPIIPCRRENRAAWFGSIKSVKERRFSKLYILPHSFSSALFGFLTRIPSRRGVSDELRSLMLTDRLPRSVSSRSRHLTYEYSAVLETPYSEPEAWTGVTIAGPAGYAGAVVFCPGAAYGPAKQWPRFAELALLLDHQRIVIIGDQRDRATGDLIATRSPGRIVNLAGATTLEDAAGIIASASLVVSNDSGLLHLAGFLGTPSIGIYGSTSEVWTRPLGATLRTATGVCRRAPCYERTCPEKHCNCLAGISAGQIAAYAKELLADNTAGKTQ
jgi:heptosyltransferase-2